MKLVMLGGRAEIPENRLAFLGQQRETAHLVLRPRSDVRGGDVSDVVHVEAQDRAHFGFREEIFDPLQALPPQPVKVDPLLPVDRHRSMRW